MKQIILGQYFLFLFSVSEVAIQPLPAKSTLLALSQNTPADNGPATASDLFKNDNTHTEGSDFFDSLGSQSQLGNETNSLPRPSSELFLSSKATCLLYTSPSPRDS